MLRCIFLLTQFVALSWSANILAVIPTPSYSHQIAFTHIWRELSLRGHKVTVVTTDPLKDPKLVNLTEIDMKWCYKYLAPIRNNISEAMTMWNIQKVLLEISLGNTDGHLTYPPVQDLLHKKEDRHFDVVLVEFLYPELLAFGQIYECPTILVSSVDIYNHIHQTMGNPWHPVLWPEVGAHYFGRLSFPERILSTVYSWYLSYFFSFEVYKIRQRFVGTYFNSTSTIEELMSNVDMVFLNKIPALQGVRPLGPTTVNIGGFRPTLSTATLPKEIQGFLDDASEGFIYFSLGSNVKSKDLPKKSLTAILETLNKLPYKVLWKFEADHLPGIYDHIKLIKWAPQQKVLSHPNIKLFVSQGGAQSMEEGIFAEVPFVVIPFIGDQDQNARIMESRGFAKVVGRTPSINEEELEDAILEVINNPAYKKAVIKVKKLIMDTPMSGLENAVWWTEYVIRNKGAKHLKNPALDLPLYQYYLLDVIGFLASVTILIIWLTQLVVRKIYKVILGKPIRDNLLKNKKAQ